MVNTGFEKGSPERVQKGWAMVQRNVERIRSMVLDILYYAKDRELTVEAVDLVALFGELREGLLKKATDLDITLDIDVGPELGTFAGDLARSGRCCSTCWKNSLDACRSDRQKERHSIRVGARRAAPWMSSRSRTTVSAWTARPATRPSRSFFRQGAQGDRLGLFISNKIVDKHGGEITVDSSRAAAPAS